MKDKPTNINDFLLLSHGDKDLNIRDVSIAMSNYARYRVDVFKVKASENAQTNAIQRIHFNLNGMRRVLMVMVDAVMRNTSQRKQTPENGSS